MDVGMC